MQKYHPQAKKLLVLSHLFLLLTFVVLSLSTCKASKPSENPQWEVIGKSGQGREIRRITFGKGPKTALLLGAVHGNEHGGRELLELVSIYLQYHPTEYEGLKIIIIPLVNPDGFFANTRLNGSGVDLNRNFPT